MKKKFLLTIIPALMVLSACAGAGPKKDAVQLEPEIIEDTLANEDLFGQGGQVKKLTPYRDPVVSSDPSLKKPVVGVQYKDDGDGKFAVRYVAAIAALDVEAKWTRGISNSAGVQQLTDNDKFVEKPVTYAYTAVSADSGSGDSIALPEDVDSDFHYFVVYTLRNVPADQLNAYLFAYLTLEKGGDSVTSLARISKVSGGNSFTYDIDDGEKYFIQGTIGGEPKQIVPLDDEPSNTNYAQEEGLAFAKNDNFGVFKYASDHFQYFGYQQLRECVPYTDRVVASNYCKIVTAGSHSIYVSKTDNQIFMHVPATAKESTTLYLKPNSDWKSDGARFAVYAFAKDGDVTTHEEWFDLGHVADGVYSVTFDSTDYEQVIFTRMNPGAAANNWDNKWNQTSDLPINISADLYNITGWDNSGYWSIN